MRIILTFPSFLRDEISHFLGVTHFSFTGETLPNPILANKVLFSTKFIFSLCYFFFLYCINLVSKCVMPQIIKKYI
jgi:hypothetical protein